MLFLPPRETEWTTGELATARDGAWFWDGQQAKEWKLEGAKACGGSAGRPTVTESARQWFLAAGGDSVVWFETTLEKLVDDAGGEREVRATDYDLRGTKRKEITIRVRTAADAFLR
jgi:hypothetical protein